MSRQGALSVAISLAVLTSCSVSAGAGASRPEPRSSTTTASAARSTSSLPGTPRRPKVEWSRGLDGVLAIAGDPDDSEELVVVSPGRLWSLDPTDGSTRWSRPLPIGAGDEVELVVHDEQIGVSSRPAGSGDDAWSVWVYFGPEQQLLTTATGGWRLDSLAGDSGGYAASILLEHPSTSSIRLLDPDGTKLFETSDETFLSEHCYEFFLTRADGRVVARSFETGGVVWRGGPETNGLGSLGCSGYDAVLVPDDQGEFLRLDHLTGELKSRVDLDSGGESVLVSTTTGILAFAEDEPATNENHTPYRARFYETWSTDSDGTSHTGDNTVRWELEPGCSIPSGPASIDRIDADYAAVQLGGEACKDRLVLLDMWEPYLTVAIPGPVSDRLTTDDDDDHIIGWPAPDDDEGELFSVNAFDLEVNWSYPADEVDTGFVSKDRVFIIDGDEIRSLVWGR